MELNRILSSESINMTERRVFEVTRDIVLASTSKWRRGLLERLGMPFSQKSPSFEEGPRPDLTPLEVARNFACAKAQSLVSACPTALIIGSDQVLELDGRRLNKPESMEACRERLRALAGRWHALHTGVAIVDASTGIEHSEVVTVRLKMRQLTEKDMDTYLARDNPIGAAGAYLIEEAGIALFEEIEGSDESAVVGLPLLLVCGLLRRHGLEPLR